MTNFDLFRFRETQLPSCGGEEMTPGVKGVGEGGRRFHTRYDEEVPHRSNPVVKARNPKSGGKRTSITADSHEDVIIPR